MQDSDIRVQDAEYSDLALRLHKMEQRLENNESLVKLSEEIVRLKEEEMGSDSRLKAQKTEELQKRLEMLERKVDGMDLRLGAIEERTKVALEELRKRQELSMKRTEITEFMLKKFEIIQNTMEQNEKKLLGLIDCKAEDIGSATDAKLGEIVTGVDDAGQQVKELNDKVAVNAEGLEKLEGEMLQLMKMMNEQNIKTQNIQWMHDELMTIKKRELQIINLLKDQSNVETEFLHNVYSSTPAPPLSESS